MLMNDYRFMEESKDPKVYKCENCGEEILLEDSADILIVEHTADDFSKQVRTKMKKKQVFKVRICKDCVEKAEVAIADWLDLPDWD